MKFLVSILLIMVLLVVGCDSPITPQESNSKIIYSAASITNTEINQSFGPEGFVVPSNNYKYVVISFDRAECLDTDVALNNTLAVVSANTIYSWFNSDINLAAQPYELRVYTNSYHSVFINVNSNKLGNIKIYNPKITLTN